MFKFFKNIWDFFKATIQFIGKALGCFNNVLIEVTDNLEKFNHEMNIKNTLSTIKLWDLSINEQKAKTAKNYICTLQILNEMSKFTEQSTSILEAILIEPQVHQNFSVALNDLKKEMQKSIKSKEYKKVVKFCKNHGMEVYHDPRKVFDFYFNTKSFAELEVEAVTEHKVLLIIERANLQVKKLKS
jgi:hypothetical protein